MTATTATVPINTKQQAVLDEVIANGRGTAAEIADRMGVMVSQKSVQQLATSLVRKGKFVKVDGNVYVDAAEEDQPAVALPSDVVTRAADLREKAGALALSPSGKYAKMVTVENTAYVSTCGRFATVKDGADKETAWSLYRLDGPVARVAGFPTCTAAFDPANLA